MFATLLKMNFLLEVFFKDFDHTFNLVFRRTAVLKKSSLFQSTFYGCFQTLLQVPFLVGCCRLQNFFLTFFARILEEFQQRVLGGYLAEYILLTGYNSSKFFRNTYQGVQIFKLLNTIQVRHNAITIATNIYICLILYVAAVLDTLLNKNISYFMNLSVPKNIWQVEKI